MLSVPEDWSRRLDNPGKKKKKRVFLPIEKKSFKSFEPDSNQRPMDVSTTTVHRSTN